MEGRREEGREDEWARDGREKAAQQSGSDDIRQRDSTVRKYEKRAGWMMYGRGEGSDMMGCPEMTVGKGRRDEAALANTPISPVCLEGIGLR